MPLDFCKESFKNNNTALEIVTPEMPINIQCCPTQISQVLLNLLNNAFDAVQRLGERWVRLEVVDRLKFIEVMVTDAVQLVLAGDKPNTQFVILLPKDGGSQKGQAA